MQTSLLLELEAAELEHAKGPVILCGSAETEAVLRQQLAAATQQVQDEVHLRDQARQMAAKLYSKLQASQAEELQSLRDESDQLQQAAAKQQRALLEQQLAAAATQQLQDTTHEEELQQAAELATELYSQLQQKDASHAEELQCLRDQLDLARDLAARGDATNAAAAQEESAKWLLAQDESEERLLAQEETEKRQLEQRERASELAEAQFIAARQVMRDELHILNDEIESQQNECSRLKLRDELHVLNDEIESREEVSAEAAAAPSNLDFAIGMRNWNTKPKEVSADLLHSNSQKFPTLRLFRVLTQ